MIKPVLFSIFLTFLFAQVNSQNYQTVHSGRIVSFENQWNDVRFLRIDSVSYQTDSVLIPFGSFQEVEYMMCYLVDGAHWIGKEIIIQDNGWNLFVTAEGETVPINTGATLGENWTAFERPGELIITANVTGHNTLTFLGIQDSVKTISFQAYDHLMQAITHPVNAMTIAISKNYGLVRTLNFALFPDIIQYIGNDWDGLHEFEIAGMSEPMVGTQNLTWLEVHDFQPGDEIHVYYYAYLIPQFSTEIQQLIYKYLIREDFSDSVTYTVERIKSRFFENHQGSTFEFVHDTITETYTPNEDFDKLPGEVVMDDESLYGAFYYRMENEWQKSKIKPSPNSWLFPDGDECWIYYLFSGCLSDYYWHKGLSGPYHQCYYMGGEIERSLVYYKKGDEEWGTPLVIVGVDEQRISQNVRVYPNPAREFMHIQLSETALPARIEMFNALGGLMKEFLLTEATQQIRLQDLAPGLYFYRVSNENGALGSGKLILE